MSVLAGCGGGSSSGEPIALQASELSVLTPAASCEDVAGAIRQASLDAMNAAIDARISELLRSNTREICAEMTDSAAAPPTAAPAQAEGNSSSGSSRGDTTSGPNKTTGTNNQVEGVDEADFLKNDGKYIYVAANGALRILRSWPATETSEIGRAPLSGTVKKMFVDGDRAVVYSSSGSSRTSSCTYGYGCDFRGDGSTTTISVFDISDRGSPTLVRTLTHNGSLIAARKVGHAVHTVLANQTKPINGIQTYLSAYRARCTETSPYDILAGISAYEELRRKNTEIIMAAPVATELPTLTDSVHGSTAEANCEGFYASKLSDGADFLSVTSFDLAKNEKATSASIVGRAGAVYASADSLYVAVPHAFSDGDRYARSYGHTDVSTVHRFRIGSDAARVAYAASGYVKGKVLNQFSMDEHGGRLRIATTSSKAPDPKAHSTLTVLSQTGSTLAQTGVVDNIAPSEDIRSVRFQGDRGFVVTFKKTDPLYVFDLANPAAPRILGELKIPGFSTYMHMMDDTHLLAIGFDADDHGSFAYFDGVLLQIFDVSDPTSPKQVHKTIIGTRGSSSEALTNHLAFTYDKERGILALPMTVCEGGDNGRYGTNMTFSGLMVFDVSLANGIVERGRVAHPNTSGSYENTGCSNWWSRANSEVKRSIFMDDYVYSVSQSVVKVQDLTKLGADLANVSLL